MEEKNELNDIILNKPSPINANKKIILAVGTLGVILIIVIMLMSSFSSGTNSNLPQPLAPEPVEQEEFLEPEPSSEIVTSDVKEPLFEEVEVITEEKPVYNDNLDEIAQKLKQESMVAPEPKKLQPKPIIKKVQKVEPVVAPKPVVKEQVKPRTNYIHKESATPTKNTSQAVSGKYYLQVGSFTTYEPNKKFLKSITDKGYSYIYHKVTVNSQTINKVLVGPFGTEKDARNALKGVRQNVERGAFLLKL